MPQANKPFGIKPFFEVLDFGDTALKKNEKLYLT
jgi:hypothetical protein